MPAYWDPKDERQYKRILSSCKDRGSRPLKRCKSMAAATVNKRRSQEGRTLGDADTRRAMRDSPDYWIRWYTFKSLALVGAVGAVGYLLGKRADK